MTSGVSKSYDKANRILLEMYMWESAVQEGIETAPTYLPYVQQHFPSNSDLLHTMSVTLYAHKNWFLVKYNNDIV